MIREAEKAISGSKTAEFQSLPLGSFSCYLDPKLLIILSFLRRLRIFGQRDKLKADRSKGA